MSLTCIITRRNLIPLLIILQCAAWKKWRGLDEDGPAPRSGHTMRTYGSKLVVFGGRGEDSYEEHTPRTFDLEQIHGNFEFTTYDEKEVVTSSGREVPTANYFNDVWSIDMSCSVPRGQSCRESKWRQLDTGAAYGGCEYLGGFLRCSHPPERWHHTAEIFNDSTMIIYGGFGPWCEDYCDDMWIFNLADLTWTELVKLGEAKTGPGKRYQSSSIIFGTNMYIFGGYRLWQGFSSSNSEANDWSDVTQYPRGGYLNDLWVYHKDNRSWENITERYSCPNETILDEIECTLTWPSGRAGHAMLIYDNEIYIHGGYRANFPYPLSNGIGSRRGILSGAHAARTSYPVHPYFLKGLWKFDLRTGFWTELNVDLGESDTSTPSSRMGHTLLPANGIFHLFGGYASNYYYDDTWQYNITSRQWRKQSTFVDPLYPQSCTDDLWARKDALTETYAAYDAQSNTFPSFESFYFSEELYYGTSMFSMKAKKVSRADDSQSYQVTQARRQAPGWDGCRERSDNRSDLPQQLQWEHPSQRSGHAAIYHPYLDSVFLFGGRGYSEEQSNGLDFTPNVISYNDLWQYDFQKCIKNCSTHGTCKFEICQCDDGHYGDDCSNSTCPGSYCYPHQQTGESVCEHCCFSGYQHFENDSYVENVQKYPCTTENRHFSNGVCDGFGRCICSPGFIGPDCSIRDCRYNCSGHGYCSVEFPNSRCMCDQGWYGTYCETQFCLNNCSYPNGACINGSCYCAMIYEPYNKNWEYLPYMGQDCSIIIPFAGMQSHRRPAVSSLTVLTLALTNIFAAAHYPLLLRIFLG